MKIRSVFIQCLASFTPIFFSRFEREMKTEVHFFAVSLMKADVFPDDYMYSNDLIVLLLLTYFTIDGRRGLISDNVVFFLSSVISSGKDLNILRQQFLNRRNIS